MGKYLTAILALANWFERQKRVLPWRDEPTLYRVWISEIMLQQTQVATVVPYFERFIGRFPTVEALAGASIDEVLHAWAGLGYYSRARNLHRGAHWIVEQGAFPQTREQWLEVPGVGPYTAGAIVSIALGQPEPILDGNVERVMSRLRRVSRVRGDSFFKQRLWKLSKIWVRDAHRHGVPSSVLNQALMELGATVCSVRAPRCERCPLSGVCRAREKGEQENYPPRRAAKQWIEVREELHCVLLEGATRAQVLLRKRAAGEWRAGLWDLLAEKPEFRCLKSAGEVQTRHIVTRHRITRLTRVWKLESTAMLELENLGNDYRWVDALLPEVAVGSALKKTLAAVTAEGGL